jgi:RNA polymerase sigma factor (sigma-70 family)
MREGLAPVIAADDDAVDIDALYRRHAHTVTRWARRLCGPELDAEDVAHEVFLLARRRLQRFEPGAKITTWLFRATEKIARSARRRQRLRRLLLRGQTGLTPAAGAVPTPLERMERDETCRRIYAILDRMPDRQRRVLILFEMEGMSTQQIADLLEARVGTVRIWLFRARARFAELDAQTPEPSFAGTRSPP